MEIVYMIRNYIRYIITHREFNRNVQKRLKKKYSLSIRIGMTMAYTFHDLDKIFTRKFLHYVVAYDPIINCKQLDFTKFNKVSMHDLWLIDGRPRTKRLYKHIFRLMEENNGFNPQYLDLVAETLVEMSQHFGEDPIAVYFRNYHQFKLTEEDRYYFEDAIGVQFEGYFGTVPSLCVEDILHISKSKSLNQHIVYTMLNEHGINLLEVFKIRERDVL